MSRNRFLLHRCLGKPFVINPFWYITATLVCMSNQPWFQVMVHFRMPCSFKTVLPYELDAMPRSNAWISTQSQTSLSFTHLLLAGRCHRIQYSTVSTLNLCKCNVIKSRIHYSNNGVHEYSSQQSLQINRAPSWFKAMEHFCMSYLIQIRQCCHIKFNAMPCSNTWISIQSQVCDLHFCFWPDTVFNSLSIIIGNSKHVSDSRNAWQGKERHCG